MRLPISLHARGETERTTNAHRLQEGRDGFPGIGAEVTLMASSASSTAITVTTVRFGDPDWGRGSKAAMRLLDAVGATAET
jgi:hypothetical protein